MITMLLKHKAITAALIGVLSLTACGQQKQNYGGPAGAGNARASKSADTKGTLGGGLPAPTTPANQNDPNEAPLPGPVPQKVTTVAPGAPGKSPVSPSKPAPVRVTPSRKSPVTHAPAQEEPSTPVISSSKRGTGDAKGDFIYTTSSTDDLMSSLRARAAKATRAERALNAEVASSITSARLSINQSGGVVITLKMNEGSTSKTYNVAGEIGENHSTALGAVSEVEGSRTTGAKVLHGSFKCLDVDGGCENTLARLTVSSKSSKAFVNIIFRKTIADSFFSLPARESGNPEYFAIETFIKNSIENVPTDDRINVVSMNTFEVVNGRSGFNLAIVGMNKEVFGFSGPLLAQASSSYVNVPLARLGVGEASSQEDSFDAADTIGEARLVGNNGQGQVKIAFKMRPHGNYGQDEFTGTFTRRIKPVIDPTEAN